MAGTGVNLAQIIFLPRKRKYRFGKLPPQDSLIMDNFQTLFATTVDKTRDNTSGAIILRFIKSISPTMFGHHVYFLNSTGPSIAISGPYAEFFISSFGVWIDGKHFSDFSAEKSVCTNYGGI